MNLDVRLVEKALREAGLSRRQARRLLSAGWPAVVDEAKAEADELRLHLEDLRVQLADSRIELPTD